MDLAAGPIEESGAQALVAGVRPGLEFDAGGAWAVEALPWLMEYLEQKEFAAKAGEVLAVNADSPYGEIVMAGLGEEPSLEDVRQAAGAAARLLGHVESVATTLHQSVANGAKAVATGVALGTYSFTRHKSDPKPSKLARLVLVDGDADVLADGAEGATVADGVAFARDLINESAMYKAPAALAEIATEMAEQAELRVRVFDEAEIAAERLEGLRGVSLGASNPPRLVELWHDPPDADRFLALVGKGIVFDSGGLSLKPAASMESMKTDMSGAAAVLAAMKVIAALKLPVKVLGITPLTENMPGGAAMRPGDVLHIRNGKTIEVLNTDAEGRLVLADGLTIAAEHHPDLIVDIATLTGTCKAALGEKIAGLMGTDDAVAVVEEAAARAGERVWHLPLPQDYRKKIDSDVADMKNSGARWGGALTAGLLLKEFAGDGPWAHLDIAGPARASDAEHYVAKGGTGFGVRTLVEVARAMTEPQ